MQGGSYTKRNTFNNRGNIQHIAKKLKTDLFNHLDKLAVGHNVTAPNTMIKFTYNKGMKDHSITSLSGNELKSYSTGHKESFSDNQICIVPQVNKNSRQNFESIVFIPENLNVTLNKGVGIANKLNNANGKKYQKLINSDSYHVKNNRKSFANDLSCITINDNNFHNLKQFQVRKVRISLQKMSLVKYEQSLNSPVSVDDVCNEHSKNSKNDNTTVSKKIIKNDSLKSANDNKSNSFSVDVKLKKDMLKHNGNENRESLKTIKIKDVIVKKRKVVPEEASNHSKKGKNESDISGKQTKEKLNSSKGKVKGKKIGSVEKEKKSSSKSLNDSSERIRDSVKKEVLREDPTLPPGWRRIIKGTESKPVVCIASPSGKKFYFKGSLKEYLEKTKSNLTIDNFHFGLYVKKVKFRGENKKERCGEGKITPKKQRKKKLNESDQNEPQSKKIRLDNSFNEANDDKFLAVNNDSSHSLNENVSSGKNDNENKNLLFFDPNLPPGWTRKVRVKKNTDNPDKIQVYIISPEGKKFRRKYLLQKYLVKTRSSLDINQFYFGLYPRKDGTAVPSPEQNKTPVKNQGKIKNSGKKYGKNEGSRMSLSESGNSNGYSPLMGGKKMSLILTKVDAGINIGGLQPMLEDPNLPPGWRRYIEVRSTGESAGKMEVVILSPDGRKHKSKGSLENYIKQKGLNYNVDDFDFYVFGRDSRASMSTPPARAKTEKTVVKKRGSLFQSSDIGFPQLNLDHSSIFDESKKSREGLMITYVSGLMLNSGLRDLRSERRLRIPKEEQEKILKEYLNSENLGKSNEKNDISSNWVQKLIHCRSDFGALDVDAAATVAQLTKEFLQRLTRNALKVSKSETNLEYSDLAEIVDKCENLNPLKTLIPKKITFREFMKLNRPKKFTSFT